jgi:hypothetical protein
MSSAVPGRRIFTAADAAQAQAVRDAMMRAGIDARIEAEEDDQGRVRMEIVVPAHQEARAKAIIAAGNWPRMA